jgi:phosphate transport system protein
MTRDLDELHRDLLSMGAMVEEMIHQAVDLLSEPSYEEAKRLAKRDDDIDRWDVRIEENCLKILALHQPVAIDLRRIAAVMKIASELERVADLAVHIAERACGLVAGPEFVVLDKLKHMARTAVDMLHRSIDAYVRLDSRLARNVCADDDTVDELNRIIIAEIVSHMRQDPEHVDSALHVFSASRSVERVADHATNIAEDVVYLVEGEIIRHRADMGNGNAP